MNMACQKFLITHESIKLISWNWYRYQINSSRSSWYDNLYFSRICIPNMDNVVHIANKVMRWSAGPDQVHIRLLSGRSWKRFVPLVVSAFLFWNAPPDCAFKDIDFHESDHLRFCAPFRSVIRKCRLSLDRSGRDAHLMKDTYELSKRNGNLQERLVSQLSNWILNSNHRILADLESPIISWG